MFSAGRSEILEARSLWAISSRRSPRIGVSRASDSLPRGLVESRASDSNRADVSGHSETLTAARVARAASRDVRMLVN